MLIICCIVDVIIKLIADLAHEHAAVVGGFRKLLSFIFVLTTVVGEKQMPARRLIR